MSCSGGGGMRDSLAGGSIHLAMGTYGVAAIRTLAEAHAKGGQVLVAAPALTGAPGPCRFGTARNRCRRSAGVRKTNASPCWR